MKNNFLDYKSKSNVYIIFALVALIIVMRAYFTEDGYLTPDSKEYLKQAQLILDSGSFRTEDGSFFAVWPIGYPLLLSGLGILGIPVFTASKILCVVSLWFTIYLFIKIRSELAVVFSSLLLLPSALDIYSYSWTEGPFIFLMLLYAYTAHKVLFERLSYGRIGVLVTTGIALFMLRYIGAFSVAVGFFMMMFLFIRNRRHEAVLAGLAALVNFIFVCAYLYNNHRLSGHITGMERVPAVETWVMLTVMTLKAVLLEMNLLLTKIDKINFSGLIKYAVFFGVQSAVFYLFLKGRCLRFCRESDKRYLVYVSVGGAYAFFMILLRWVSDFDDLNFRLLFPGSVLIFTGLILMLRSRLEDAVFASFSKALIATAYIGYFLSFSKTVNKVIGFLG